MAFDIKVLLIGYGNPARADDGLGPAVAEYFEKLNLPNLTVDADYQLTIEDSAAVAANDVAIFADASVNCAEPFTFERLKPGSVGSFSSHSVDAGEVLTLAENLFESKAKCFMLGIRGYDFDGFDKPLSERAKENLAKATVFLENLIKLGNFDL